MTHCIVSERGEKKTLVLSVESARWDLSSRKRVIFPNFKMQRLTYMSGKEQTRTRDFYKCKSRGLPFFAFSAISSSREK